MQSFPLPPPQKKKIRIGLNVFSICRMHNFKVGKIFQCLFLHHHSLVLKNNELVLNRSDIFNQTSQDFKTVLDVAVF